MKADEAAELLAQDHETDLFKRRCAIVIAVFASYAALDLGARVRRPDAGAR